MSKVKDEAYFSVQAWMVTKLGLKTTERDCYAIIYGYSQDEESDFHGNLSYLAELTGYSKNSICTALKNLTEKGYILKNEIEISGVKVCRYKVNFDVLKMNFDHTKSLDTIQATCTPIQATCTNNINNNNKNKNILLSKDNNISENASKFSFGKPQAKKSNMYETCLGMIYSFTNNVQLQDSLIDYLNLRLEMKNEKPFYGSNQWKGLLNKLAELSSNPKELNDIVKQSILKGWGGFFKLESENGGGYKQDKKSPYIFIEHTMDDTGVNHNLSGKKY